MRAVFMNVNMASRPLFGSAIIQAFESSKLMTAVAEALMPILCSRALQTTWLNSPAEPSAAGKNFGMMNSEMPRVPAGASGRQANTTWTMFSAMSCSPAEMKILVPVTL